MSDPTTLATAITTGALVAFTAWREAAPLIKKRRRAREDSERPPARPGQPPVETEVAAALRTEVAVLRERQETHERALADFLKQLPHLASADEVATYIATTNETLRNLTGRVERAIGMIEASGGRNAR